MNKLYYTRGFAFGQNRALRTHIDTKYTKHIQSNGKNVRLFWYTFILFQYNIGILYVTL